MEGALSALTLCPPLVPRLGWRTVPRCSALTPQAGSSLLGERGNEGLAGGRVSFILGSADNSRMWFWGLPQGVSHQPLSVQMGKLRPQEAGG